MVTVDEIYFIIFFQVTPELLTTSVGKGKVKNNAKGKEKTGELTLTEGEDVDIIRMIDNPSGKWLVRVISSQKGKLDLHNFYNECYYYSEVTVIRPPIVLVENCLNSEQVLLMRKMHFGTETSVVNNDGVLNFMWSL